MTDSVLAGGADARWQAGIHRGGRDRRGPMFAFEGVFDAKAAAMKLGFKAMMRIEDHFLAAPRVAFSQRHLSSRLGDRDCCR